MRDRTKLAIAFTFSAAASLAIISDESSAERGPAFGQRGGPAINMVASISAVVCGDGLVGGAEECDDDDTDNGDGCSSACEVETGWSCEGEPSVCTLLDTFLFFDPNTGAGGVSTLIGDSLEARGDYAATESALNYMAFPGYTRTGDGADLICARVANQHALDLDNSYLGCFRSTNNGETFQQKQGIIVAQTSATDDPYTPALFRVQANTGGAWDADDILLSYEVDFVAGPPFRRMAWKVSTDHGLTWSAETLMTSDGSEYDSAGGSWFQHPTAPGTLFLPYYMNTTGENRRCIKLARTVNGGTTVTPNFSTVACDASAAGGRPFEEPVCNYIDQCPDSSGGTPLACGGAQCQMCLIRNDETPRAVIYKTFSCDHGVTWSPIPVATPPDTGSAFAFYGLALPSFAQDPNDDVIVVSSRNDPPDPGGCAGPGGANCEPTLFISRDDGTTFQGPFLHAETIAASGAQMYSQVQFTGTPNQFAYAYGQERGSASFSFIAFRRFAVDDTAPPVPNAQWPSQSVLFTDDTYDFGAWTGLDGATTALIEIHFRVDQNLAANGILLRHSNTGQQHLDIRTQSSGRINIEVPGTVSTFDDWMSANFLFLLDEMVVMKILYDEAGATNADRLRIFTCQNNVASTTEVTAGGVFTGTIPATSMTNPDDANTWTVCGQPGGGGNACRDVYVPLVRIWANPNGANALSYAQNCNGRVPIDASAHAVGLPNVNIQVNAAGNFVDTLGTLAAPTIIRGAPAVTNRWPGQGTYLHLGQTVGP